MDNLSVLHGRRTTDVTVNLQDKAVNVPRTCSLDERHLQAVPASQTLIIIMGGYGVSKPCTFCTLFHLTKPHIHDTLTVESNY